MGVVVGIDLGTSNSAVATKGISIRILKNKEGEELTPSSVTFLPEKSGGETLVGRPSVHMSKQHPESTVRSIKRLMGHEYEDRQVQEMLHLGKFAYPLVTDSSEPGSIRVALHGQLHSPESISAAILNKLVVDSQEQLGAEVTQAVVTVPAYFSDRQKFATRAACVQAGLTLLRLLPEPTAAALSFGLGELEVEQNKTVMVFDLGGGTFDVSILNIAGRQFLEVTKGGDMWLGGDDIDQLLLQKCLSETEKVNPGFKAQEAVAALDSESKARFLLELKEACERAKIKLSTASEAAVEVYGLLKDPKTSQLIDIDVEITRDNLNTLLGPMNERLKTITTQTLQDVGYETDFIDTVVMVGGSSAIPLFQETMGAIFGKEKVLVHPRPMLAIAEGAAIMAHKLASKEDTPGSDTIEDMLHSSSHSYYLQLAEGKRVLLMERNASLPHVHEELLEFQHKEQKLARLRVLNEVDGLLETVGEMWLYADGDAPTRTTKESSKMSFHLKFEIDEDNIIRLSTEAKPTKLGSDSTTKVIQENTISRGGLAVKLRNEMESILAQAHLRYGHYYSLSLLQLSKIPSRSIVEMTNPFTGILIESGKTKAIQQVETLRQLSFQEEIFYRNLYETRVLFDLIASDLSLTQKKELESLLLEAESELHAFTDAKKYIDKMYDLMNYTDSEFDFEIMAAINFIAKSDGKFSKDASKLEYLIKTYTQNKSQNKTEAATTARISIENILSNYSSVDVKVPETFHRDVVQATL